MGNGDRNSVVKHVVYGLLTRYVRFLPQTYQGLVCLRTEVFGVKQKPGICAGMIILHNQRRFNIYTFIILLAVHVGNIKQILCCDWLSELILLAQDCPL